MNDEDIRRVLGLLYQQDTLTAFAALVLGGEVADGEALERLRRGGLAVREEDGTWRARPERFRELLQATAVPEPKLDPEEKVLRTFLVDGRLREIPMKHDKRMVVLRYIAQVFEPGVRYPEKDVDVALRAFHDDYPALRRYLVDAGLLAREDNVYWRSGGPVAV
ncbi:DUF2087 domain-containing protein [Thermoactinospora rubra]|uniref:DUF2087 domain-containing protein n=1 Tax=Thermoactinospora rubra TaxID=1088767 RepID=UPI000A10B5A6|nr:DUF2087 domain-containing protein [Thermoactinospora rubra]